MHPTIAKFPSRHFYDGKLKNGVLEQDRKPFWSDPTSPVVFMDVNGRETKVGTSFANDGEVDTVKNIVKGK